VVLAVALLIVGAIALVGAMNSSGGPAVASSTHSGPQVAQSGSTGPSVGPHAVVIKVTGPQANVIVSTQDNSNILLQGTLPQGEVRTYDENNLVVTVDPAQNVVVLIHNQVVSVGKTGKQSYTE
jgi:hypothetical protein